jgi:short-subunit dehydrogenase
VTVPLRGSNALITGAAGGLGRYIARSLAAEGVNLAVSDLDAEGLTPIVEEARGTGVRAEAVDADLTDSDRRSSLISDATDAIGPLDILVNNAGIEHAGTFTRNSREELETIVTVNLIALMDLTLLAVPGMLERGRGHVVNLASMAGKLPALYLATYGATKHGVVGFTHALRAEYAAGPVSFSAICPIFISRVGMYGRHEHKHGEPPPGLKAAPPEAVGEAVVAAVRDDRAEVVVTRGPIRPLLALYAAAPGLAIKLLNRRDTRKFAEDYARARGRL